MTKVFNPNLTKPTRQALGISSAGRGGSAGLVWRDAGGDVGVSDDITLIGIDYTDNGDSTGILAVVGAPGFGTPPWFNVKDFGAVGDGTTLDCDAINAAIDAINANGGGTLFFPHGQYLCDSGLNAITAPCDVRGEAGRGSPSGASENTEIICSSATATLFTVQHHVTFRDLQIRNSHATPTAGAGIAATATADLNSYDNLLIKGFWINLDIQQGGAWSIHNCAFIGPVKYALKIANSSGADGGDWSISNAHFMSSDARVADAAIRIESAGGGKITNSKINFLNSSGSFTHGIDLAPAGNTSILLIHGNSFENYSGDGIHVATSGFQWDHISIVGNQFGQYANTTGNAIEVTCANVGEVDGLLISSNIFRQTGGGTPVAVNLTKVNDVMLVGNIYELGFAGGNLAQSGCTNVVNLDLLGGTPSGELGGTWDAITVDATHSGSAHLALGSTGSTAAAGNHTHSGSVPPAALLESGHATPFTFDEWLQASDGSDVLWASA